MPPQIRGDHIYVTNLSLKLQIATLMPLFVKRPYSRPFVVAFALCSAALAAPAVRADVMEIGPQGAVWKTSANYSADVADLARAASQAEPDRSDALVRPDVAALLTTVDSAAGPEEWQPHVEALARKYDVSPLLLEAVVWQESRWNTRARSPAGARGLAQLMPGTARQLGVDSSDPIANLEGGARYLRMQLDHFGGDVEKALAAYNAGPGRVERANGIPRIRETRDYVASIMTRLSQPVRR